MEPKNYIDLYCERLDGSFWAEPLNAFSNLAFLLAAYMAYLLWRKSPKLKENLWLIILAAIVGIGSFTFHTFASFPSMLADIIPIIIFIHYTFLLILRRVLGLSWKASILLIAAFLAINVGVKISAFSHLLNGSIQYVPTLLALSAIAVITYAAKKHGAILFVIGSVGFLHSLTCRSIDMQICDSFPLGTHFMWHILNPIVMYTAMRALIKTSSRIDIKA